MLKKILGEGIPTEIVDIQRQMTDIGSAVKTIMGGLLSQERHLLIGLS